MGRRRPGERAVTRDRSIGDASTPLESIPANRRGQIAGTAIVAAIGAFFALAIAKAIPGLRDDGVAWWIARLAVVLCALMVASGVRELVAPLPLVEVVDEGVRLRITGGGRRFVLVPWSHLEVVRKTTVPNQGGSTTPGRGRPVPALGFRVREDDQFRLPDLRVMSAGNGIDAPVCNVTFRQSFLHGDAAEWAARIEAHRPVATQSGAATATKTPA